MTTQQLSIKEVLRTSGAQSAERQLGLIGHYAGDVELSRIVAQLEPGEVAALVKEGDFTKPSMATHFITSEQFIGALERFGSSWVNAGSMSFEDMLKEKRHLADFITSVVLATDNVDRREELLGAMLSSSLMRDVLNVLPLYEQGYVEFLEEGISDKFDPNSAKSGTWEELFTEIFHLNPRVFRLMCREVLIHYENERLGVGEKKPLQTLLKGVLTRMNKRVCRHVTKETENSPKTRRVFEDI